MNLIFLDTETTGPASTAGDRLIQLAYRTTGGEEVNELFDPGFHISYAAMAVHHITDEMVAGKPDFKNSEHKDKLIKLLEDHVLVAHNAPFDNGFLKIEGVEAKFSIDTFKVAYKLLEEDQDGEELTSHSLQYLRYAMGLNDESAVAHDAFGDIIILEKLFYLLFERMKGAAAGKSDKEIITEMINISNTPLLLRTMKFGKHRGKTFTQVLQEAPDYLEWLSKQSDLDENLRFTLEHYLNELR